jgi:hypothetical protein
VGFYGVSRWAQGGLDGLDGTRILCEQQHDLSKKYLESDM